MNCYWVILSVPLTRQEAKKFKCVMYKENGIARSTLYLRQDKKNHWRVVRRMTEWHLRDPLLGNRDDVAQYRRHLKAETQIARRMIKGRLK